MHWLVLSLVPLSFALAASLTWCMLRVGRQLGQIDKPNSEPHKAHARAVPNIGGVGIAMALLIPMVAALAAAWWAPAGWWGGALGPAAEHLAGLREQTAEAVGVMAALLIMHAMGLVDDRRRLSARFKLVVQLAVALGLALFFDMRVATFLDAWGPAGFGVSVLMSVLWMAGITNAMNMLDNMDGLSGGVGAIIAAIYLAATLIGGQWFVAGVSALLLGALLGFLLFNFPPARIFMGDGGALVLGLTLAILGIRTTYVQFDPEQGLPAWHGWLMPLVVMAIPLYDLVSVSVIRIRQGRSPFSADQQHFSHRLVQLGLSRRSAVLVIWLCTLSTGLGGVIIRSVTPAQAILLACQAAAILALLATLEYASRQR